MYIVDFEKKHVEAALMLSLANYAVEKQYVKELPEMDVCLSSGLNVLAENGFGVAAFEGEQMIGFLCCVKPFDNAFRATDVRGVFSPMGAHAAVYENRSKIYAAMYQKAAKKWVKAGAVSHAICLYAHDEELKHRFFEYGFGLRCLDAIRAMDAIECFPCYDYDFQELSKAEYATVHSLDLALNSHYRESPFFMNRKSDTLEEFMNFASQDEGRIFVARQNSVLCAYLLISAHGETCVAEGEQYRHINGAYCLPKHRGKGVYQNLLNFCISMLKKEGYTRLGVDFESFNPTARGFWLKYFTPYTNSVVRRIDERIIQLRV